MIGIGTLNNMQELEVLVNADDFGLSSMVNTAIARAFESSLISTCTIMATGEAFEEACELAQSCTLASNTGLHFVLDAGLPLTDELRRERRFCGFDGQLLARRPGTLPWLTLAERRAVAAELRAQIARCRSVGLRLTHIDSHHHIHEEAGIICVILAVMREENIRYIRPMQNLCEASTLIRRTYTRAFNTYLQLRGATWTRYFGSISDFLSFVRREGSRPTRGSVELMVHPAIDEHGRIIDNGQGVTLADAIGTVRAHCRSDRE